MITIQALHRAQRAALVLSLEWAAAWIVQLPQGGYMVGYDDAGELPENVPGILHAYVNGEEVK